MLSRLKAKRQESNDSFSEIFDVCRNTFEKLNIPVYLPRLCVKMSKRSNPNINDPVDCYRITIFIPFIDSMINDLTNRFSDEVIGIFNLDLFLPKVLAQAFLDKCVIANKIKNVMDKFGGLLSKLFKGLIEIKLKGEIELWYEFWVNNDEIKSIEFPDTAIDTLKYSEVLLYPCITFFLKILSTLPASTSAERNCSSLRRLKTWLRTRMTERILNGLALIHAYKDSEIDIDKIINVFAAKS